MNKLALTEIWAIRHEWLQHAIFAAQPSKSSRLPKVDGQIAILPMYGMITQRASIWQEMFGGTSTQAFGAAYTRAVNDDRIKAVVFDVDSPGGTTAGVEELSDLIYEGAQRKTTVAIANSQAASAAYWLASQVGAGRFFAAPGADVGSIGVFRMHEDLSGALEQEGVKVDYIAVPEYKTEANPYEPLSEEAREFHLGQVQATYDEFVKDVARGRGVNGSKVRADYGKGRMFHAVQAAELGMVDGVRTLPQALAQLGVGTGKAQLTTAESQGIERELCAAWEGGTPERFTNLPTVSISESRRRLKVRVDRV